MRSSDESTRVGSSEIRSPNYRVCCIFSIFFRFKRLRECREIVEWVVALNYARCRVAKPVGFHDDHFTIHGIQPALIKNTPCVTDTKALSNFVGLRLQRPQFVDLTFFCAHYGGIIPAGRRRDS